MQPSDDEYDPSLHPLPDDGRPFDLSAWIHDNDVPPVEPRSFPAVDTDVGSELLFDPRVFPPPVGPHGFPTASPDAANELLFDPGALPPIGPRGFPTASPDAANELLFDPGVFPPPVAPHDFSPVTTDVESEPRLHHRVFLQMAHDALRPPNPSPGRS